MSKPTGLGALNGTSVALLDCLVHHADTRWVRRWIVVHACPISERSGRRSMHQLRAFGLVEQEQRRGGVAGVEIWIRATPLGRALIQARYASEVAA